MRSSAKFLLAAVTQRIYGWIQVTQIVLFIMRQHNQSEVLGGPGRRQLEMAS